MWIDDQVWNDTIGSEWHISWIDQSTNNTFLSVSRCKFITNFWYFVTSDHHSDESSGIKRFSDQHIVNISLFAVTHEH